MSFFRGLWKSNSKHKKLCEEWALANSCESVGPSTSSNSSAGATSSSVSTSASDSTSASASSSRTGPDDADNAPETIFSLKYLGSTLVESPSSEVETAEAIKTIISMAKASGKKLPRVSLAVSLRGIRMTDLTTEEEQLRISIYSISYCSADARHDHVFAFIATNPNETMQCHAYLCPKRKVTQTVTLTVAQAFNTAYELWKLSELDSEIYHGEDKSPNLSQPGTSGSELDDKTKVTDKKCTRDEDESAATSRSTTKLNPDGLKSVLIDIAKEPKVTAKVESWVSFEESYASSPDEGIPLKNLKSPSTSTAESIAATKSITSSVTTTTNVVAPQQPKLQNAWLESIDSTTTTTTQEPLDVVCSS